MKSKAVQLDMFMKKESTFEGPPELVETLPELPKGWRWVRLGEILLRKPQYGLTARSAIEERGVLYIRISDITENGHLKLGELRYVEIDRQTFRKYELEKGDILIARSGSVGRVYLHENSGEPSVFASYLIRFKLNEQHILPKFFFYYGQSPCYKNYIETTLRIVAQPNINARELSKLEIPLPPLEEQKRIVAWVEEILSRVEQAKKLREEALKDAETIMRSALHDLFSRPEEKGWQWRTLRQVCSIDKESRNPSVVAPREEFIYIDISGIESGTGRIKEVKRILGHDAPSRARRVVHTNNVIMSTVRPYLKSFAIVPQRYDNQICSTGFAVLCCEQSVLPRYLLHVLFWDGVIDQCNKMMIGAHYPALNSRQVAEIRIPVPPLNEQDNVVTYLDRLQEKVEVLKQMQAKTKEQLEAIVPTVLDRGFKGQI